MKLRLLAFCVILMGLGWVGAVSVSAADAAPPPGQVKLFTRLGPAQINAALEAVGVTYRIESDRTTGRPIWICRIGQYDAQLTVFDTDNLRDGTYDAIELTTSFSWPSGDRDALAERMNDWNVAMRLSTALVGANGTATLCTDRSVRAGVTPEYIQAFIRLHGALHDTFAQRLSQAPTVAAGKGPKGRRLPMEEEAMPLPLRPTH